MLKNNRNKEKAEREEYLTAVIVSLKNSIFFICKPFMYNKILEYYCLIY
jgi:hypothetical protein